MATILYRNGKGGGTEQGKFPAQRVPLLLANGWRVTPEATVPEQPPEETEVEAIREELTSLGVKFHPNTGIQKLKTALAEAKEAANVNQASQDDAEPAANPWEQ